MTSSQTVVAMDRPEGRDAVVPERPRRKTRPVWLLWRREMTRLRHSPIRLVMGLVMPLLFLVVLGTGLDAASSTLSKAQLNDYRAYLFPGALVLAVQAPAIAVGISLVWDRRMGALRQMLVAPLPRSRIMFGLALGGATTGAVYGLCLLAIGGIAGVRYTPMLLVVLFEAFLVSLMFTSIGLLVAVTIRQIETFQIAVSLSLMPLTFFSGAMFPPSGLPGWLDTVVKLNPLTYGVDAVRRTLPGPDVLTAEETRLLLWGWQPPVLLELGLLAGLTALCLGVATFRFTRSA